MSHPSKIGLDFITVIIIMIIFVDVKLFVYILRNPQLEMELIYEEA